MRKSLLTLGCGALSLGAVIGLERRAEACGGCFQPPTQVATDITDERMLLSVSPTQTTLYDQIQYSGSPSSFAWVLPIHGTVDVGLSADVLFDSIDELTATQIPQPAANCPPPPDDCVSPVSGSANGSSGSSSGGGLAAPVVTVTKQQNVGPYATVQLHATDSSALNAWLTQNGYTIPADVLPVVDEYVTEGFDFLAMKLLPNQGIQSMRPVRVTTAGASLSLPLRMAAVGTGASVGITIWVVSDGRYEPQNFPFFHIEDSELVWDFSLSSSNYTTLRASHEAALGGKGWEIESSIDLNETLISSVIESGGSYYSYGGGSSGGGFAPPAADAGDDYLPTTDGDGGVGETADQVRTDDVGDLFAGMNGPSVRITRIRSDITHASMSTDFVLQASVDQTELSNIRTVTNSINLQCPIYNNCTVVGSGPPSAATPVNGTTSAGAVTGATTASGGGCVTAAAPNDRDPGRIALFAGAVGLVAARIVRSRKRAAKK